MNKYKYWYLLKFNIYSSGHYVNNLETIFVRWNTLSCLLNLFYICDIYYIDLWELYLFIDLYIRMCDTFSAMIFRLPSEITYPSQSRSCYSHPSKRHRYWTSTSVSTHWICSLNKIWYWPVRPIRTTTQLLSKEVWPCIPRTVNTPN